MSIASLAPTADDSTTNAWIAKRPVSTLRVQAEVTPRSRSITAITATQPPPHSADTMVPAAPRLASAGNHGENTSSGSVASDGSGFHTKPIAARCGSRENST